jgi:molybdate transport system ATP-binding protein
MAYVERRRKEKWLVRIENADVSLDGAPVLFGITWELKPGEHWAVTGRNGSGKTTFLKLLSGEVWPDPVRGRRLYCLDGEAEESPLGAKERISYVSPELQDSYIRNSWDMTGEEVIHTGFFHSGWLHEKPGLSLIEAAGELIERLGIGDLREKSFLAMSRGEARKTLIARALVSRPKVLVLDEVCDGLDAPSREGILDLLDRTAKGGTQLVYAVHRTEELVDSISHVLLIDDGRIASQGRKSDVLPPPLSHNNTASRTKTGRAGKISSRPAGKGRLLLRAEGAAVYLGERKILDNINWRMRHGENWAVLGRNGSGKSTLLRLICGDLHPALGGRVRRFGARESGSIWDTRKRIGYVSSELQTLYTGELTGREVVLSGLFSSIGLYNQATKKQHVTVEEVIVSFGLERLARKKIGAMSYGELRKVLIARAAANAPEILVLDEPCTGLDQPSRIDFLDFLEKVAQSGTGIVMAVHHRDELIPSITHVLVMDGGKISAAGKREEWKSFPLDS